LFSIDHRLFPRAPDGGRRQEDTTHGEDAALVFIVQQLLQAARVMVQEIAHDGVVFRILVADLGDAGTVEAEDFRARIREQDRREW